jgi:peptidyl-prolyl cis-trans isomerase C
MKNLSIVSIIVLFSTILYAQKTAPPLSLDTLARVGSSVITERDLIERIELMPWEGKENPNQHDSSKIKALNSLVAERLLAIEGKHLNIGSDELTELKIRGMEKMFVRDELFKREVKQKVTVSENEMREGLAKFAWQLHIAAIAVKSRSDGDFLVKMLNKNISLAKIATTIRPTFITAVETVQVNFGGLDTLFENEVYAIGKKKFSKPFVSNTYGWTVALIIDRGANPVYEKMNSGDRRIRVDETIRQRKENIVARRYFAKILSPQKAKTDSVLFFALAKKLRTIIIQDSARHINKGLFGVMSEDVDHMLTYFHSDIQKSFVELNERPLLFGEAIEAMRNLRLGFPLLDESSFVRALNYHLRSIIETELMSREGYRQNLHFSESVQRDLQSWSNYWISRYLMWRVNDSVTVSNDELLEGLRSSLSGIGNAYEVSIQEVLCDSLTTAMQVWTEYSHGISLSDLAKIYSKRSEWKEGGGVSQFIPLTKYPDITLRAFLVDTGTIVGPVKISEGYSLFKVLGKRSIGAANMPMADSIPINIKNNLLEKKRGRSMSAYVASLAKNYTVDLRHKKLSQVTIQPANMYTRRMIGFGGVITATPILYPNWEWMNEYREMEKQLP